VGRPPGGGCRITIADPGITYFPGLAGRNSRANLTSLFRKFYPEGWIIFIKDPSRKRLGAEGGVFILLVSISRISSGPLDSYTTMFASPALQRKLPSHRFSRRKTPMTNPNWRLLYRQWLCRSSGKPWPLGTGHLSRAVPCRMARIGNHLPERRLI
jgi:hypothetical protein